MPDHPAYRHDAPKIPAHDPRAGDPPDPATAPLYALAGGYTGRSIAVHVTLGDAVDRLERDYPGRWDHDALVELVRALDVAASWTSHHGARGIRVTRTR